MPPWVLSSRKALPGAGGRRGRGFQEISELLRVLPNLGEFGARNQQGASSALPCMGWFNARSLLLHHLPKALCWELGLSMLSPSSEGSLLCRTFPRGDQLTEKRITNHGICAINVFFRTVMWF